jgi:hypothetical protein
VFLQSWYKVYCVQARLPRASEASDGGRGTKFYRSLELIPGYIFGCGHWRSVALAPSERSE